MTFEVVIFPGGKQTKIRVPGQYTGTFSLKDLFSSVGTYHKDFRVICRVKHLNSSSILSKYLGQERVFHDSSISLMVLPIATSSRAVPEAPCSFTVSGTEKVHACDSCTEVEVHLGPSVPGRSAKVEVRGR